MSRALFSYPSDDVSSVDTATLPVGTPDALFPLSNLFTDDLAQVFHTTSTSLRIVWDHGSAAVVALFALFHHNLDAGLDVRFQMHATDSWGAPSFSTAVTIPAADADGYTKSPFVDLSATNPSYRYRSLYVAGTNSVGVRLGRSFFSPTKRTMPHNVSYGMEKIPVDKIVRHRTYMGVPLTYDLVGRMYRFTGQVQTDANGLTTLANWRLAARARPHVFIPDPSVNEALYGQFVTDETPMKTTDFGVRTWPFSWQEVGKGLPLSEV